MLILLIVINLVFCGVGVWEGYRIAQAQHEAEIEELKKTPVTVKYVHANFVPVTVQWDVRAERLRLPNSESVIKDVLQHELGRRIWDYASLERTAISLNPLSDVRFKATVHVRPLQDGDHL